MGNSLTGDFEAVLEISIRQINGMLATIHQNSVDAEATPSFLHSEVIRVGDDSRKIDPHLIGIYRWLQNSGVRFSDEIGPDGRRTLDLTSLPPGVSESVARQYADWVNIWELPGSPDVVRGKALVQVSTPTLTVAHGSTSELTMSVFVRVHYERDGGTKVLPDRVHGEVRVTYRVSKVDTPSGPKLKAAPPSQDDKIRFIPAPGTLSSAEARVIADEIRKVIRGGFKPTEVNLPPGFSFSKFLGLAGSASDPATQSLALPVALAGGSVEGNIHSIPGSLLEGKDFAVAVSKEYVNGIFQPLLNSLKSVVESIQITHSISWLGFTVSATYTARLTAGPAITWKEGGFDLTLAILAHTDSRAPDANIRFSQGISLVFDANTQNIRVEPAGEPWVELRLTSLEDVIPSSTKNEIKASITNAFKNARDQALRSASTSVYAVVFDAFDRFHRALRSFDRFARGRFQTLHVSADGIVARGNLGTQDRRRPIVRFREKDGCYNAHESWVPGGRAVQYNWGAAGIVTRILEGGIVIYEYTSVMPVEFGTDARGFDPHGFVRSKPNLGSHTSYSQVCLTLLGNQISPDGSLVEGDETGGFFSTGGNCLPELPEPLVVIPEEWGLLTPGYTGPGIGPPGPVEFPLESLIVRHYNMATDKPLNPEFATNTVIYFADWNSPRPLAGLARALEPANRRNVSLGAVVVLPVGAFKLTRREFDEKLGLSDGALASDEANALPPLPLQFTEDYEGAWSRTFDVKASSGTVLVNARGEFSWKQDGALEPAAFREALGLHALPAAAPRSRLLQTALGPGDLAPDVYFEDDRGEYNDLRRMRGRPVLLNFWKSWSQPSLRELGRLQSLHEKGGDHAPYIVAHAGDKDVKVLSEVKQANKLTFAMAHDANLSLARQFGVRCWPTTVSIDADGIIDHIQYGTLPRGGAVPT